MGKMDQGVESTNEADEIVVMAETTAPSGHLAEAAGSGREKAKNTTSIEIDDRWAVASRVRPEKIETLAGRPETAALEMRQQRRAAAENRDIGAKEGLETEVETKGVAIEPTEEIRETERSVRMSSGGSIGMTEGARGEAKKPTGPCRATARKEHDDSPEPVKATKSRWIHIHDWLTKD